MLYRQYACFPYLHVCMYFFSNRSPTFRTTRRPVPDHLTLRCQIDVSLDRLNWKRRPGRQRNKWQDLVRQDSNCSAALLWIKTTGRGHGARVAPYGPRRL